MNGTIAGTGHRPPKLGGYHIQPQLVSFARQTLERLRPELVISGMALGWDQALAEAAHALGIPFYAYIPFVGQGRGWPAASRDRYHDLLALATAKVVCSPGGYSARAMQVRNERMVDRADLMLALWDGSPGGTANCIRYATTKHVPIKNVYPAWVALHTRQPTGV